MSVGLDNAQFKAFVDFAQGTTDMNTIAYSGNQDPQKPFGARTIAANTDDKVRSWFRSEVNKDLNNEVRRLFKGTIAAMFGGEANIPDNVLAAMKLKDYDGKGHPLTARRILAVKNAIAASQCFKVSGEGPALDALNDIISTKYASIRGSQNDKLAVVKRDMNNVAKNCYNMNFARSMQEFATGKSSQFEMDHLRLSFVPTFKVGNETLTFNSKTPLEEKKDIIARFVTGGVTEHFDDLVERDVKKAQAVMAILDQRFTTGIQEGIGYALSPHNAMRVIQFGDQAKSEDASLAFSFDDKGAMQIRYKQFNSTSPQFTDLSNDNMKTYSNFKQGASTTITADVSISATELNNICDTDYAAYDYSAVEKGMYSHTDNDPNAAGVANMGEFRFGPGVTFDVGFSANLTDCRVL